MGGLFKKPKAPSASDIAEDSFEATPNIFGPGFKSQSFVDPKTGRNTQQFTETGRQAQLTDQRGLIARRLGGATQTLTNKFRRPDLIGQGLEQELAAGPGRFEEAIFDRASARLQPQLDLQERNVRNNLVNTGNPIGTERAQLELDQLNRNQSAQLNDLSLASVLGGLQGQGQQLANIGANTGNRGQEVGQLGGLFSILQADRAPFLLGQSPLSPALAGAIGNRPQGASPLAGLGTLAGAGIGGFLGGPAGAAVGAKAGGAGGSLFG